MLMRLVDGGRSSAVVRTSTKPAVHGQDRSSDRFGNHQLKSLRRGWKSPVGRRGCSSVLRIENGSIWMSVPPGSRTPRIASRAHGVAEVEHDRSGEGDVDR